MPRAPRVSPTSRTTCSTPSSSRPRSAPGSASSSRPERPGPLADLDLAELSRRLGLLLDDVRAAADHVATLIMVTDGRVASGPFTTATNKRARGGAFVGLLGAFQRGGPAVPLGDQLRRAREALADLPNVIATIRGAELV